MIEEIVNMVTEENLDLSEKNFQRIADVIYDHCGINLHDGKKSLVRARLAKRMRECRYRSTPKYIDYALSEAGSKEFYSLVDSISTNLTSFFREKVHFDYLQSQYLPNLIAKKGNLPNPKLRVWSAGCSSGEEPYTMSIVLTEMFENTARNWDVKILASDVSTRMLEIGQMGTYDADRVKPLTPKQKLRFLTPNKIEGCKVYQANNELKKMITFRYLNLMEKWPFNGPFDIIFCRNVMIYFDKKTQEKLINRYWDLLPSGGLLCIGHSESLTGINHKYDYVQPATYMKP